MKKQKNNFLAFTFVELIIVIVIISILWAIWFTSYIWSIADSRDSQRKSDLSQVSSALKIYKQKRWYYSLPWDVFYIAFSWSNVATQWQLNKNVRLNSLDILPYDPKNKYPYSYSVTSNKQEFELSATLENSDIDISLINWNYKSVSKNILPTILLATWATLWSSVEIKSGTTAWDINRNLFIYNNQIHNLSYKFTEPFVPYTDWITFDNLLTEVEYNDNYWQNTDYRNCTEIEEWWKLLIPLTIDAVEYQIITETWALVNTWCTL